MDGYGDSDGELVSQAEPPETDGTDGFNPSIVPHLNQDGVPDGAVRFIMSFRATGEDMFPQSCSGRGSLTLIARSISTPSDVFLGEPDCRLTNSMKNACSGESLRRLG
jgi:hypothetical protein